MRETYRYNNEEYIYDNGSWVTPDYIKVPTALIPKLNKLLIVQDLAGMSDKAALDYIEKIKASGNYMLALRITEKAVRERSISFLCKALSILTSLYREAGNSQKAIQTFLYCKSRYGYRIISPMVLTSVAAAYCDLGNKIDAKRYADWAYRERYEDKDEMLMHVYQRIKSMRSA